MALVETHYISKIYGHGGGLVEALRSITISIEGGEFVALSGPSGCGKSSLLSIIGLITSPTNGDVILDGQRINYSKDRELCNLRRTRLGFVFQYFNLLPTLTAEENVMLTALLSGASQASAKSRSKELLAHVGLSHRHNHLPDQLSGGEMQRIAICRALAHQPKIILADEPTGNLDTHSGHLVLDLLKEAALNGSAVMMATHREDSLAWCNRVLRLHDGVLG
jgi:putative ABC transport system ATP-binding protein